VKSICQILKGQGYENWNQRRPLHRRTRQTEKGKEEGEAIERTKRTTNSPEVGEEKENWDRLEVRKAAKTLSQATTGKKKKEERTKKHRGGEAKTGTKNKEGLRRHR